jgi:hypothetical protein
MEYTQPTPITSTPADQTFEPPCHCVNDWGSVMGFDTTGGTKAQPAGVDYARTPAMQDSSKDVKTS